jgi:hypothetical protein
MTSDRTRVSYDPSRHYHGVIAQQGRVSLDADWNEAVAICGEQIEARTLDIVGSAASPDAGYRVDPVLGGDGSATGDLMVRSGTLYLGGQRLRVAHDLRYSRQPDWLDSSCDRLWSDAKIPAEPHELIYLLAREQEVSATEDRALRDVALGGPDTTQRLRFVQHVCRRPTAARSWQDAWGQLIDRDWTAAGWRLCRRSHRLEPAVRLQVTGYHSDIPEQPVSQGNYLGPNNQFIRIQIARVSEDGVPYLVWAYDNASFVYRVYHAAADGETHTKLQLATPPVDAYHQPAQGQAVEILRSAAALGHGDFIAAAAGVVAKVTRAYHPDSRTLVVNTSLSDKCEPGPHSSPLFLRIWQHETRCEPGEEHELGQTGISIRLTLPDDNRAGQYPVGAYWMVALRPGIGAAAADLVYPQRIMDEPQPPDGPRQWLTPMAFVRWHPRSPRTQDCIRRFDSLIREEVEAGSCTVRVRPDEVGDGWALQDVIDANAGADRQAIVCLEPGTYTLPRPLRIGPQHGRLTIKAAGPGVELRAHGEAAQRFALGLIIAEDANGFCVEGLDISPTRSRVSLNRDVYLHQPERARVLLAAHRHRAVSIGLHAIRCTNLTVRDCSFAFSLPAPGGSGHRPDQPDEELFAVGLLGSEELTGLLVERCVFAAAEPISHARTHPETGESAEGPQHVVFGFAQVSRATIEPASTPTGAATSSEPHGSLSVPLLDRAVITGSRFEHLTAPLVVMGQLGSVRIERNTVRHCHAGFWLVTQQASHVVTLLDRLVNLAGDAYRDLLRAHLGALAEPLLFCASALARVLPRELADDLDADLELRRLEPPSTTEDRQAGELLRELSSDDQAEPSKGTALAEHMLRRFREALGPARAARQQRPDTVAVAPGAVVRCRLDISANSVECRDAAALVVLNTAQDSAASLILTGNRLRSHVRTGEVACLYLPDICTAVANVIVNEGAEHSEAGSLVVRPRRVHGHHQCAVSGNVMVGRTVLPHRPEDLPSWRSLNSVTQW